MFISHYFEFIRILFLSDFLETLCSNILSTILLYDSLCYSPSSIRVIPLRYYYTSYFKTQRVSKIPYKYPQPRFSSVNAILRLCYQLVTLQKWTHDLVTESFPFPIYRLVGFAAIIHDLAVPAYLDICAISCISHTRMAVYSLCLLHFSFKIHQKNRGCFFYSVYEICDLSIIENDIVAV